MIERIIARLLAVAVLAGSFAVLSACNTMAGAGKDLERAGKAIENKARQ